MIRAVRPDVIDLNGRPVELGDVIGQGGEGAVYTVKANPETLAKIYHQGMTTEKAEKVRLMATMRTAELLKLAAWPSALLINRSGGQPAGLLMPRVADRKDIHHLYSPKSRRADFTRADWRFLIRAATNTARAFGAVHDIGCVIGDVNHGGVLVAQDATVSLIDCDSFQVSAGGRRFLCEVGVPTFTPPELQGKPFKGIVRTANADNFGLAVMTFLLLFMGRHPFAGRFKGPGEMPIEKAIEQSRFAYGALRNDVGMARPPGTPPLSIVGDEVSYLFERAFAAQSVMGGRPTAQDWISGLQKLERSTRQCKTSPSHWHANHLGSCPWCEMERATGAILFPVLVRVADSTVGGSLVDVEAIWKKVEGIPAPGTAPAITFPAAWPSAQAKAFKRPPPLTPLPTTKPHLALACAIAASVATFVFLPDKLKWICLPAAIIVYFIVLNSLKSSSREAHEKVLRIEREAHQKADEEVARFRKLRDDTEMQHKLAQNEWIKRLDPSEFRDIRARLETAYVNWKALSSTRVNKLAQLQRDQRKLQLDRFLDRFDITDANISGIGPGRQLTLASYGISTAEDITQSRLSGVPGFGPAMSSRLLQWRATIEKKFVFNPQIAHDLAEVQKIESFIRSRQILLEKQMKFDYDKLVNVYNKLVEVQKTMRPAVEAAAAAASQASQDYQEVIK